jgi:hypothetical protein
MAVAPSLHEFDQGAEPPLEVELAAALRAPLEQVRRFLRDPASVRRLADSLDAFAAEAEEHARLRAVSPARRRRVPDRWLLLGGAPE